MRPLISVIVPTRNRPVVLADALASVARQRDVDPADIEVVVVNDGGSEIAAAVEHARDHGLAVTAVELRRRRGLPAARNAGIEVAGGEHVGFLDDDDVYLPHHLSTLLGAFERDVDVVYGDCLVADRRTDPTEPLACPEVFDFAFRPGLLEVGNIIPVHSAVLRNPRTVGTRYDTGLAALEDWDFWLQLRNRHRYRFAHLREATVVYHRIAGEASMTGDAGRQAASLADFGRLVQRLWRRWPATTLKATRFRGYLGNMYWLALAEFARQRQPHFSYYLRSMKALAAAWTGELPEADLVDALADAVMEEPADVTAVA